MEFTVREGKREDVPQVLELIRELALYERAPHEVTNTVEMMLEDGFGKNPVYGMFVAEINKRIIGISVYYFRYSTWKGRRLYLEDIVVTESMRGNKIGKALFEATMEKTLELKCSGLVWQVLDWNEPALNFYRKYNASMDSEWVNCALSDVQIREYLGR
jgi:GNAT superfamily N-acetyltransferase